MTRRLEAWEQLSSSAQIRLCLGLIMTMGNNLTAIPMETHQDWGELINAGLVTYQDETKRLTLTQAGQQCIMKLMEVYVL